jgi:hypothetical protein
MIENQKIGWMGKRIGAANRGLMNGMDFQYNIVHGINEFAKMTF